MNENHAKKVEQAFAARLSLILTGSGFRTDIGLRVFRGRRKIDPDQIPCVVIVGGDDTITAQKRGEVVLDQRRTEQAVGAHEQGAVFRHHNAVNLLGRSALAISFLWA